MIKNILRQHILLNLKEDEVKQWFEPLIITKSDKKKIIIQYPHSFFYHWFDKEKRQILESYIRELYPNVPIIYKDISEVQQELLSPDNKENNTVYTLDNFIFNKKNDFPVAVAKKIIEVPFSDSHFPLILYGKSGSGKTHILYAIAHSLRRKLDTIFLGTPNDFKKISPQKKEQISAFFIDEMQQAKNNISIQQSLLDLFIEKQHKNTLIAITIDDHPLYCKWLTEKLRMRLSKGVVVELKTPDLDIRHRYIRKKNTQLQLKISKDNLLHIAQNFHDIRLIDGALNKIKTYYSLVDKKNTSIMEIIDSNNIITPLNHIIIIRKVAEYYSFTTEELVGKNRGNLITTARQVAMYFCRELLGISLIQIGAIFSGRSHTSVLYAINKIKQLKDTNKDMNISISQLKKMFSFSSLWK